jgi:hypothetical protein
MVLEKKGILSVLGGLALEGGRWPVIAAATASRDETEPIWVL